MKREAEILLDPFRSEWDVDPQHGPFCTESRAIDPGVPGRYFCAMPRGHNPNVPCQLWRLPGMPTATPPS